MGGMVRGLGLEEYDMAGCLKQWDGMDFVIIL